VATLCKLVLRVSLHRRVVHDIKGSAVDRLSFVRGGEVGKDAMKFRDPFGFASRAILLRNLLENDQTSDTLE
jgi:hypothetical protein